jgi:hypothetical protein
LSQIQPGTWQITATKAGFKSVEIKDVQLLVNNPATINIKFENVGGTSETVTVVATFVPRWPQQSDIALIFDLSIAKNR